MFRANTKQQFHRGCELGDIITFMHNGKSVIGKVEAGWEGLWHVRGSVVPLANVTVLVRAIPGRA